MKITLHKEWWSYRKEGLYGYFVMFMMPVSITLFILSFTKPFIVTDWGFNNQYMNDAVFMMVVTFIYILAIQIRKLERKLK